jgi:hypothetical protein
MMNDECRMMDEEARVGGRKGKYRRALASIGVFSPIHRSSFCIHHCP